MISSCRMVMFVCAYLGASRGWGDIVVVMPRRRGGANDVVRLLRKRYQLINL